MVYKSFSAEERSSGLCRRLTISECDKPETIQISVYDSDEHRTQTLFISREDWDVLTQATGRYSSQFTWVPKPEEPPVTNMRPEV